MPKDNKNTFFKEKKIWSEVKDELLGGYLAPYFSKILRTGKPTLYVDCFAGKGRFDDGSLGSPLIALQCLIKSLQSSKIVSTPDVQMKFIERDHAEELRKNLSESCQKHWTVMQGQFQEIICPLLSKTSPQSNIFLYVDPYGVKVLNSALFDAISKTFDSVELLINFNSFGFIREACRVKKMPPPKWDIELWDELQEYDTIPPKSISELSDAIGGNYWEVILEQYNNGIIDGYEAEKELSRQYKHRLRQQYKYVLDMPIRLKPKQHPKYRMVHATNHPDGCCLMADDMAKRTERLVIDIQNEGQMCLFPQTAENIIVDDELLIEKVKEILPNYTEYTRLNAFLADFYNEFGVLCEISRLSTGKDSALKTLERGGYIDINRCPSTTPKEGKTSTFWQEKKNQTIHLRKRR